MRGRILWSFLRKSIVDLRHVDDIILEPEDTRTADATTHFSCNSSSAKPTIADLWHAQSKMQGSRLLFIILLLVRIITEEKDC